MRQIVRRVVSLSEQILKDKSHKKTRGNTDFIDILNSYPEFLEGVKNFKRKKRGRPTDNPSPEEVEYLVFLVESLYVEQGKEYTRDDRRKLKDLLNRAVDGADFFDPVKAKHWINLFSALDYNLHLFTQKGNGQFGEFFTNYISFYSKLNNKKIVPFYARWIKELAAMYTIYLNETFEDFEETRKILQAALDEGINNKKNDRFLRYETEAVRNYIMTNIFVAYGRDKNAVLKKLCDYIKENPSEFVYESGEINSRYRRYYCTIREMLGWLNKQQNVSFADDELLNIFTAETINYEIKDQRIKKLEFAIVSWYLRMYQLDDSSKLTEEEEHKALDFFVKERARFDEKTHTEIVLETDELPFEKKRTIEEAVDCVVKLLRLLIMLLIFDKDQNDETNEYEIPSKDEVVSHINRIVKQFGLLPLPTHTVNSYNDNSFMDYCLINAIEESFYDEE